MYERAFTLVELMVVIAVVAVIVAIAIPNLARANNAAEEASAIASLRTLISAQTLYRQEHDRYSTAMAELSLAGLIDNQLGSGTKANYILFMEWEPPNNEPYSPHSPTSGWAGIAMPDDMDFLSGEAPSSRRIYVANYAAIVNDVDGSLAPTGLVWCVFSTGYMRPLD